MKLTVAAALLIAAGPAFAQPLPGATALPSPPLSGDQLYQQVCQACHMANAMGATGAGRIAALAGNKNLAFPEYPIGVVTGGKGAMPWFRGQLTDQQIADVIGYVRTHFGNNYRAKVTAAQVAESGVPAPHESER